MDSRKRKFREHIQIESGSNSDDLKFIYPQNICFYLSPPFHNITLDQFKKIALERLSVLRILENANKKKFEISSSEWRNEVFSEIIRGNHENYFYLINGNTENKSINEEKILMARHNDYISHFILRLVYCRSEELKIWFILREIELFKLKFSTLSEHDIKRFFENNQLNCQPIKNEEINDIKDELRNQSIYYEDAICNNIEFYRVHFTHVPELISNRKCFLKKGFAYITIKDFESIVSNMHKEIIESGLTATKSILYLTNNDERISDFLKSLATSYIGRDYARASNNNVSIEEIDNLSITSFPLCMRKHHEILRKEHKLNYFEQTEYTLFLKGIGVSLSEAIR